MPLAAFVVFTLASGQASAQSDAYTDIRAQFAITGKDTDPPPGQKKDRLALFLSGKGAKKIYDALPVASVNADACEEGLKLKTSGGLICASHADGAYACSVAILLKSGETRSAGSC